MAVFKCKMCGGALNVEGNLTTATCEYCGSQQTLPRLNDDKLERLYDRANHFRRNNEFDKAMGIYEQILDENNEDAESYWSLVLCRYGIEYVEDPTSHKRIPTVNRVQYTSIFDDDNYKSALQYADISQKILYEQEARAINEIQKGILDISQREEPFDVFICYKETDERGQRTHDSVYANEIYHELTEEGMKVFFARITLEDKLGVAYEPYIFAALNSAKVMVVIGTRPEFFNAVWVRNEWSRYLALIKKGEKKVLIPAYRDMDPYDLPQEFSHLQAQDMNKLGFMPDLIRGIKKLVGVQPRATQPTPAPTPVQPAPTVPVADPNPLYNVRLMSFGDKKLLCIKIVMETLGLGLKEAKDLVESRNSLLAKNIPLHEAERIANIFRDNGFDVSLEEAGGISRSRAASAPVGNRNTENLLKRAELFLESHEWDEADTYCEKVLDIDPENVTAYIYKLLAMLELEREENLVTWYTPLEAMTPYKNALRFADEATAKRLAEYNRITKENHLKMERQEKEEREQKEREREQRERERQIEQARREQMDKKHRELNSLRNDRTEAEKRLSEQKRQKERLQEEIDGYKRGVAGEVEKLKKARIWAVIMILLTVVAAFGLVSFVVLCAIAGIDGNDDLVAHTAPWFALGMILYIVLSGKFFSVIRKPVWLALANLYTVGILVLVMACLTLGKWGARHVRKEAGEVDKRMDELKRTEDSINQINRNLQELDQKIAAMEKP